MRLSFCHICPFCRVISNIVMIVATWTVPSLQLSCVFETRIVYFRFASAIVFVKHRTLISLRVKIHNFRSNNNSKFDRKLTRTLGNNGFIWEFTRLILRVIRTFIINSFQKFHGPVLCSLFCRTNHNRPWSPGLSMNKKDLYQDISMEHKCDQEIQRKSLHARSIRKAYQKVMSREPGLKG